MATRMTEAEQKEILELFESGSSCAEIAELTDRQYGTIWRFLDRNGLLKKHTTSKETFKEEKPLTFDAHRELPVKEEPKEKPIRNLHINRGEIYYIKKTVGQIPQQQEAGRPAIIVSNNKCNLFSNRVEVVFLTTQEKSKDLPTHVTIMSSGKKATALCEDIQTVYKTRIAEYIGTCTDEEIAAVNAALADSIGLNLNNPPAQTEATSEQQIVANDTAYQTTLAERDTYKKLYDELLEKIIKSR